MQALIFNIFFFNYWQWSVRVCRTRGCNAFILQVAVTFPAPHNKALPIPPYPGIQWYDSQQMENCSTFCQGWHFPETVEVIAVVRAANFYSLLPNYSISRSDSTSHTYTPVSSVIFFLQPQCIVLNIGELTQMGYYCFTSLQVKSSVSPWLHGCHLASQNDCEGCLGCWKQPHHRNPFLIAWSFHLEIWVWFYFHPYHCYWKRALESHSSLTITVLFLISSLGEITASSNVFLITKTHLKFYQNIAPYTFS